ncbi:MAG: EAL domain-containing protein [Acidaminococcaceae bacterium]|nr:EAL domain-containing protein [Acidaminococcaceae bacterium]
MKKESAAEFLNADFSKQYIANGLANIPGGFFVYKAHGEKELLYANHELLNIFECETAEQFLKLTGGTFRGLVHPDDMDAAERSIQKQLESDVDHLDHLYYRIITRTGKVKSIVEFGRLYRDPKQGEVFYVFIVDVQSKQQTIDIDKLTGLPGMRSFIESSEMMLHPAGKNQESIRQSLVFYDIAHFKYFNIKYGMATGNEILKSIAGLLTKHYYNNFIFRLADDHFVVLTETENLMDKITRFHKAVLDLRDEDKVDIKAGIYSIEHGETSAALICDLAKIACDEIKFSEIEYYNFYTDDLKEKLERKRYIIETLDQAISENYIRVYYQSIIRSATGAICGKEALARWIDPVLGLLSPAEFIPVLEEAKLLYKLDLRIVELALQHIIERKEQGLPVVKFSVNISRYDFEQCDMVAEISKRVRNADVSPEMLIIEITETVQGIDQDYLKEQIRRFHEAGFKVWMDDFGTGFSSLDVLQDFDFDLIKLDMQFIQGFGRNRKNPVIIKKLIEMAYALGIDTLAEGVETKEQIRFLKEIGCDKLQGFYYSRPHPYSTEAEVATDGTVLKYEDKVKSYEASANKVYNYNQSVDYDYFKLNTYKDIPVPYALYHVILNEAGDQVIDTEYVFVNQKYCELVNKTKEELLGKRFSSIFTGTGGDWFPNCYKAAILGQEITDTIFSTETQLWLHYTIAPTSMPLHCSYTFLNIDKEYKNRAQFEKVSKTDKAIIRITEVLNSKRSYSVTMNSILEEIGGIIHPDRLYILETDGKTVNNTFEWCADGIKPAIHMLQNIPHKGYLDIWEKALDGHSSLVVENIDAYRKTEPQMYEILKVQNIRSLIEAPLYDNGRIIGYLGADNYHPTEEVDTRRILETVTRFISRRIINYQLMKKLENINTHDMLTGILNRYAMQKKTAALEKTNISTGIVFIDLNGLKDTNDKFGHKEGDRLIKKSAAFLTKCFGVSSVYRTGGDEFNVLLPGISEQDFKKLVQRFAARLKRTSLNMSFGVEWCESTKDIVKAIAAADKKMYEAKAEYYIHHDRRKKKPAKAE